MEICRLNNLNSWQYLPWCTINMRLFMLQKKIYKASKLCQQQKLHKWQNILLNSDELKVIAIENVCKYIIKNYLENDFEKYCLNNRLKFFLFKNIFCKHNYNLLVKNLLEKIKQYIICACMQPEWNAKFEPMFNSNFSYYKQYIFQEKLANFFSLNSMQVIKNQIYYCVLNKYIHVNYIIDKFQSLPYIKYCFKYWFNSGFINESIYLQNDEFQLEYDTLYQLIYRIICTGIEWFTFKILEVESKNQRYNFNIYSYLLLDLHNTIYSNYLYNLNFVFTYLGLNKIFMKFDSYQRSSGFFTFYLMDSKTFNIYNKNFFSKFVLNRTKSLIYKKNKFGRKRFKKYLKTSQTIQIIFHEFVKLYRLFCLFLNIKTLTYMIKNLYFVILLFLKKKDKRYQHIFNDVLNKNLINKYLLANKNQIVHNLSILKFNR